MKTPSKRAFFRVVFAFASAWPGLTWAQSFSVGASHQEMKAPQGVSLAGYFERHLSPWESKSRPASKFFKSSIGQHDPLRIKALVMSSGNRKIALVSLDLVAVFPDLRLFLIHQLKSRGFQARDILVTATHTHSSFGGFVKQGFWEFMATDRWIQRLSDQVLEQTLQVVLAAEKNLSPARISTGSHDELRGMTFNRRGGKDLDPRLHLIQFIGSDGKVVASLINFAVHGALLPPENLMLSGDVPGEMERRMEKATGAMTMFLPGAAGDIDPVASSRDFEGLERYGRDFETRIPMILKNQTAPFEPRKVETAIFSQNLDKPVLNVNACLSMNFFPRWLRKIRLPRAFDVPAEMTSLRLDNHVFIFIPGEPFTEIGSKIQNRTRDQKTDNIYVIGMANSYQGYIMDKASYEKGGYEGCNSFYGPLYGEKILHGAENLFGLLWR